MGLLSFLGFNAANSAGQVAKSVSDIVGQWVENPAERATQVDKIMAAAQADVASARKFGGAMPGDTGFSAFADGLNKLVRPVLAVGVIAMLYSVLPIPDFANVPSWVVTLAYAVFGYYFGVISVVDDLPRGASRLLKIIKG